MTLAVHLLQPYSADALEELCDRLDPSIELTTGPHISAAATYEILIAGRPAREDLIASPRLRALIIPWAGLPDVTRALLEDFPSLAVHNLHHNAIPVAEMAITLMLAAAKSIVPIDRTFRRHDWTPRYERRPAIALAGKTALILGYGAIGCEVAYRCQGLGMEVLATRRHLDVPLQDGTARVHPAGALRELLPRADALLVCLPHTAETDGLIGEEELALLPPGALLVNVGRGAIVDEAALYNALRDGPLFAAGLDVWYAYPADEAARANTPPSAYPFYELDNVVMSPHRAGWSQQADQVRMEHLAVLLNAAARGAEMPNRVDVQVGY